MALRSRTAGEKLLVRIGVLLLGAGLLGNEWVLTALLSPDGVVEPQNRRAVWLFELLLLALGLGLVWLGTHGLVWDGLRRLSHTAPRLVACALGLGLTVLLVGGAEGIFYGLNHLREQAMREETSWVQRPPTAQEGGDGAPPPRRHPGGAIPDPVLGYALPKHAQIADTMTFQGTLVYQGTYTTDAYGRRITPIEPPEQRRHFLLFFGCSVTFGLWVHDDETMPFYAAQYAPHYRPYNYGVSGYGPNQMLAQLQNRDLTKEMPEPQGIAIYTFIDDHIYRALRGARVSPPWGVHTPLYILDSQDRLVLQERATFGSRLGSLLFWGLGHSQILTYFHIMPPPMPRIKAEHMRLTARVIEESRKAFHQQFPRGEFYVLLYPGVRRGKDLLPYLAQAGIPYLDYSHLIDWPHPELTLAEPTMHPAAQGHKRVAAQLAHDLRIAEGAEAQ
jgi:hypothetical protein